MNRASRLMPIADYAGKLEDEAARRLAFSANALQGKEREVEQLRSYLAEYRQRAELEQQSTDSLRWQNSRAFLARLCAVVAAQETELANAVEAHRLEVERWRASYRRSKSLDQVIERGQREEAQVLQKRAQAEARRIRAAPAARRPLGNLCTGAVVDAMQGEHRFESAAYTAVREHFESMFNAAARRRGTCAEVP